MHNAHNAIKAAWLIVVLTGCESATKDSFSHGESRPKSKTIQFKATGERITFLEDSETTEGERLLMEVSLTPNGKGPGPHVHHHQTESFEVIDGVLGVQIGKERNEFRAGERIIVPAGTVHDWWNAGEDTV